MKTAEERKMRAGKSPKPSGGQSTASATSRVGFRFMIAYNEIEYRQKKMNEEKTMEWKKN